MSADMTSPSMPSFSTGSTDRPRRQPNALSIQLRLIIALVLRDLVAEIGRSRMALFWIIFRPISVVALMYLLMSVIHRLTPQGMPLLAFLVTGWSAWFMFMRVFKDPGTAGKAAKSMMMFPHLTSLDLALANLVTEWFIYTFVFVLFVAATLLFERSAPPAYPLKVIMAYWSIALMAFLASLTFFSFARIVPGVTNTMIAIRRLGHLVTGVSVTAADTPHSVLKWMTWNPLFHAIELMREAWWPAYVSPIADPWYVLKCVFFMAATGLIIERATRRFLD